MSSIVDYTDRTTCIIFGDGAGSGSDGSPSKDGYGIQDSILKSDGSGGEFLHLKAGGSLADSYQTIDNREHYVFQDGQPSIQKAF